jgi:hypothetical protein
MSIADDDLLGAYLAGDLDADQAHALSERLAAEPALCARLVRWAADDLLLVGLAPPPPPAPPPSRPIPWPWIAMLGLTIGVLATAVVGMVRPAQTAAVPTTAPAAPRPAPTLVVRALDGRGGTARVAAATTPDGGPAWQLTADTTSEHAWALLDMLPDQPWNWSGSAGFAIEVDVPIGSVLWVEVLGRRGADERSWERFEARVVCPRAGWQRVTVAWSDCTRRSWQPPGAPVSGLDPATIAGFNFGLDVAGIWTLTAGQPLPASSVDVRPALPAAPPDRRGRTPDQF